MIQVYNKNIYVLIWKWSYNFIIKWAKEDSAKVLQGSRRSHRTHSHDKYMSQYMGLNAKSTKKCYTRLLSQNGNDQ